MRIERQDVDGIAVLALSGKMIGGEDAGILRSAVAELVEQKASKVLVDLSEVPWMNSSGIGFLVSAYVSLRNAGAHVRFLNLNERVRSILAITKVVTVFESYSSREEALASFQADEVGGG